MRRLLPGREPPLLWSLPKSVVSEAARERITLLTGGGRRSSSSFRAALDEWLVQDPVGPWTIPDAALALAIAYALPLVTPSIGPDLWWNSLQKLTQIADDAATLTVDRSRPADDILLTQLLAGELPLALAYVFPEIRPCRKLRKPAQQAVSIGIEVLCDGEGVLPFRLIEIHRPLAASWTRCLAMATAAKNLSLSDDALAQLEWHVRQLIRTARSDGGPLLGRIEGTDAPHSTDMLAALLRLSGDASDAAAAYKSLPGKLGAEYAASKRTGLPEPSVHSEWAELTVLRTDWRRRAPRIAIGCDGPRMQVELETGRETVFCGDWEVDIQIAGKNAIPRGEWEVVCWYSDDEVDYFELAIDLAGGGQIERQVILAREDQFLILADNVLSKRDSSIRYCSRLPLADNAVWLPEEETTDGLIVGKVSLALAAVLPIGLPEWRCDNRIGALHAADRALCLEQQTDGRNMCCPLFFDLKTGRLARDRTWRQLTVAESLEIQPRDVAAGFRIQCGKQQWLAYRSLAPCANRTLLGQNFSSEFFLGRFLRDGSTDELVEIEAGE